MEHPHHENVIYKVVLTGGPCAGKTSSMAAISEHFRNLGWNVYCSTEAATMLVSGGVSWAHLNADQAFHFQKNVIKAMMLFEDTYMEIAKLRSDGKPTMILCDRGVMDCAAYVDEPTFSNLLDAIGAKSVFEVKDNRYDIVIHLFSAAIGAEEHYVLENNQARTETAEQAKLVDQRILKAWTGHPHIVCIDNRTIFREKVVRAVQAICRRVGVPVIGASTVKRRLKVAKIEPEFYSICTDECDCEYTYLSDGEIQQRLRKRGSNGAYIYTLRTRNKTSSGVSESSRNMTKREYDSFMLMALPDHISIFAKKRSFVYNNQYFNLIIFENGAEAGGMLLEIYEDPEQTLELPAEIKVEKEVTNDSHYSLFNLSKAAKLNSNK